MPWTYVHVNLYADIYLQQNATRYDKNSFSIFAWQLFFNRFKGMRSFCHLFWGNMD